MAFFSLTSAAGLTALLFLLIIVSRKPSRLKVYFLCFFGIGVFHLSGILVTLFLQNRPGASVLQHYWMGSLAASRLRYLFLVLFVHSFFKFRLTFWITLSLSVFIAAAIISPFFVYSLIPSLMEIAVVVYSFAYLVLLYFSRDRLALSAHLKKLLRTVLFCFIFFLMGILLDLLEEIPQVSVYISILLIDFHPLFLICLGGLFLRWAWEDLHLADNAVPGPDDPQLKYDLSAWPVTEREREIIGLILSGNTNSSIADTLFIAESTVKKHINNIFRKLNISSRWELLKLTDPNSSKVVCPSDAGGGEST